MFVVSNLSGVVIAKFRSMTQVNAWADRIGIIMENVTVRFDTGRINDNEWVREDYR